MEALTECGAEEALSLTGAEEALTGAGDALTRDSVTPHTVLVSRVDRTRRGPHRRRFRPRFRPNVIRS